MERINYKTDKYPLGIWLAFVGILPALLRTWLRNAKPPVKDGAHEKPGPDEESDRVAKSGPGRGRDHMRHKHHSRPKRGRETSRMSGVIVFDDSPAEFLFKLRKKS